MKEYLIMISFVALSACTSPPKNLKSKDLVKVDSVEALIVDIIGYKEKEIEYRPFLTFPSDKDILLPALYIQNYCQHIGGHLNRTRLSLPYLERTNKEFSTENKNYVYDDIVGSFGRFSCSSSKENFVVDITHNGSRYADASARKTLVSISIVSDDDLERERIALRQRETLLKQQELSALQRFNHGQINGLKIGYQVCSKNNFVGYVEDVKTDRVKVLLTSKLVNKPEFSLFMDGGFSLAIIENRLIWGDVNNWSECKFKDAFNRYQY